MNSLLTKKENDKFHLELVKGVFISFHAASGEAVSVCLKDFELTELKLESFLTEACSFLKIVGSSLHCKVVGALQSINKAEGILKNKGLDDIKLVQRDDSFEIIFIPKDGLVRLSKLKPVKEATKKTITPVRTGPIRVMVVDDSKTIRGLLTKVFNSSSDLEVVASIANPLEVEAAIKEFKPDVMTLDIHMPEMNGVELLKKIYPIYKIPTIMITSVSLTEGPLVLEALEKGAFDYIQKPKMEELQEVSRTLIEKVISANKHRSSNSEPSKKPITTSIVGDYDQESLIVIGSSTGGTNALKDILTKMPSQIPPVLIVQHIPAVFSKAFADRINSLCPFTVKEAEDGESVKTNTIYIAEGGKQMRISGRRQNLTLEITDDEPVNRFKPSVDYLFDSVEPILKDRHVVGVVLTGMGRDGAKGLLKLRNAGAYTIAQDEESSVVFGMPKEAIAIGGAQEVVHLDNIASMMGKLSHKS